MKKYLLIIVAMVGFAFSAQAADNNPVNRVAELEKSAANAKATLDAQSSLLAYETAGIYFKDKIMASNLNYSLKKCLVSPCCDGPPPSAGCVCVIDWYLGYVGGTLVYLEWAYWSCPGGTQ